MTGAGLEPVADPAAAFLAGRTTGVSGSAVTALMEGTRPLLVEIQALAAKSGFGTPQRVATGLDHRRLAVLLAVLERRGGLPFGERDGVVVVAAGAGVRAGPGEPKQFRPILGVPMLLRALRPFTSHPDVGQVIVVVPVGFDARPPEWLGKLVGDRLALVAGGATRTQSVRAGLGALPPHATVVLVHDAARPFVTRETSDGVIAKARPGVGAVAAIPVSDTVHAVEQERITKTVPRNRLWRAQTPQGFPRAMIERAYAGLANGDAASTDDAELCERAGFPVEVVPDSPDNLKVTTADDFRVAEALARELR